MGGKLGKEPNQVLGTKDQTDTIGREGRSIFASRTMITSGFEDMSNLTADQIPLPTTDIEMEIVSTSTDDTALGTGAQSVLVVALGEDLREAFQIISLSGTTPTATLKNFTNGSGVRRINSFLVQSVGTVRGAAVGTIVIRDKNDTATIFSQIDPGDNSSQNSLRTVPANTTVSFTGWGCSSWTVAKVVKFRFQTSFNEVSQVITPGVFTTRDVMEMSFNQLYKPFPVQFVIREGTDLIVTAMNSTGGGGNPTGLVSYQYFIQRS